MGAESQHLCSLPLMPSLMIRRAHTHNQAVLLLGPVQQQGVTAAQAVITACAPARATWSAVHAPGRPCHAVSTCMAAALPLQSDVSAGTILETQRRSKVPKLLYAQIAIFLLEVAFVSECSHCQVSSCC